jgi:hypothetical protein
MGYPASGACAPIGHMLECSIVRYWGYDVGGGYKLCRLVMGWPGSSLVNVFYIANAVLERRLGSVVASNVAIS